LKFLTHGIWKKIGWKLFFYWNINFNYPLWLFNLDVPRL
jgi:hypothetical protein